MIDDDEPITSIDLAYLDQVELLRRRAMTTLVAAGMEVNPIPEWSDPYTPPDGTRRTVWAALVAGFDAGLARSFKETTGDPLVHDAADTLWCLWEMAEALAQAGEHRPLVRRSGLWGLNASTYLYRRHALKPWATELAETRRALDQVSGGLQHGPGARKEIADIAWRQPLRRFLETFVGADPLRQTLDGVQLWRAFLWSEPWREGDARRNQRQWPSETTAAREVNRMKPRLLS